MGLIDRAKADIERITSNSNEFGRTMTFLAPTAETAVVIGLHTKHHIGIDSEGNVVNSKRSHVSVSEKFLTDASYPVRNSDGEVNLRNHEVTIKDSTGLDKIYIIQEWFPDELLGLVVCILGDIE